MDKKDVEKKIEAMKTKRKLITKILLVIPFILVIFVLSVIFATYYLKVGYTFVHSLPVSFSTFCVIIDIIIAFFIILIILLHFDFKIRKKKLEEALKPKPVFYKGKRLYTFTYPEGARGGVFSKTIIEIDDKTAVNIRCQVIRPQQIWK